MTCKEESLVREATVKTSTFAFAFCIADALQSLQSQIRLERATPACTALHVECCPRDCRYANLLRCRELVSLALSLLIAAKPTETVSANVASSICDGSTIAWVFKQASKFQSCPFERSLSNCWHVAFLNKSHKLQY